MIRTVTIVSVCGALALAGPALAADAAKASLTSVKGAVAVSQDGKFAAAKPGALRAGDRVVAKTGEARVSYADGCVVTLKPGSMATIGATSPCASQQGLVTAGGASAQASFGELSPFGMAMGALAVVGFVYGVVSMTDDEDDVPPVSP
jgi:hypothetical protein